MTDAAVELHPAAAALRARAVAQAKRTKGSAIYTDATSFSRGKFPATLVAIARPSGYAIVLAIDNSEFGPAEQMAMAGLVEREKPAAIETAQAQAATLQPARRSTRRATRA